MNTSHDIRSIRLTSGEISELWVTYLNNSASRCVLQYFKNIVEDRDIKAVVEFALDMSQMNVNAAKNIFETMDIPIPYGFNEKDVNINAKRLFSDPFMLHYLKHMVRFSINNYSESLGVSAREDVRKLFTTCIESSVILSNKVDDMLLSKGLYTRPPHVDTPKESEFVKKQSYIHGLFGDKRALNVTEITQIFINMQTNLIGKAFTMGLSQTIQTKRVQDYVLRGKEVAEKHIAVFADMLQQEDLPSPMTYDADILGSTDPVFSDKLIMFHVAGLNAFSIALYANSMAKMMRADLLADFARLSAEIAQYAKDGIDIMIDNEWLEKSPEKISHKELIHA